MSWGYLETGFCCPEGVIWLEMPPGLTAPLLALGSHQQDVCCSVGCLGPQPPLLSKSTLPLPFSVSEQSGDCGWCQGEAAGEKEAARGRRVMVEPRPCSSPKPQKAPSPALRLGQFPVGPRGNGFCLFDIC